jgi:hypothetical protein
VADAIGGIVNLCGRADSAAVADKVVALFALANAVDVSFIGVAGRGAEAKVEDVTLVADTRLGCRGICRVNWASTAGSISHSVVLG